MEKLSIASFLASGHEYHLYVYEKIKNAPEGIVLKAADEILPASMIFKYKECPSYAGFANFFRYKLLLEKGGWWVDTDHVCLKPFVFEESYVFASERLYGRDIPTSSVIKVPPGSEIMEFNWHVCQSCADPSGLRWGEYGPRLMTAAIAKFKLEPFLKEKQAFCPLDHDQWDAVLRPRDVSSFGENTYSVHLWNEMWRRAARDKNASYAADCLYERLKGAYLSRGANSLWADFLSQFSKILHEI
jgi:hypothetical protein